MAWLSLQTTGDKVPKLPRHIGWHLRRRQHTNGAHQARPIPLPRNCEQESAHVELKNANLETPYIPSVRIVLPIIQIDVDPLWTHVGDGAHRGATRVDGLHQDYRDPEVGDLNLVPRVEQEVQRLDVAVNDVSPVQVGEFSEDLAG